MILHLVPKADWDAQPASEPYRAKSLDTKGFIHATQGDDLMLQVANSFYKDQPGEFLVLEIDESKLASEVKWEPPASPAGEQESREAEENTPPETKAEFGDRPINVAAFPHIYGPLNRDTIVGIRKMVRAEDGTFIGYAPVEGESASDPNNPLNLKTPSQMAQELLDATDEFSESLKRFKDSVEGRMAEIDKKIKKL